MLSAGDTAYCYDPFKPAQIGQTFWLSLYMLFSSHSHRQDVSAKDLTWKEVMYKCRANLQRVPLFYDQEEGETTGDTHIRAQNKIQEYCYELSLVEDLNDGRVHDSDNGPYEDVLRSGLRTRIPVHQIAKMFYTTSGKLLGIEESRSPILLVKRDMTAQAPRKILDKVRGYFYSDDDNSDAEERHANEHCRSPTGQEEGDHDHQDLPKYLDPEWLAFEIYVDDPDDASSATISPLSSAESSRPGSPVHDPTPPPASLANALTNLALTSSPTPTAPRLNEVRSDLSILECLLRLTILQNFQQAQHTTVHDELLNLFLSDASWGGSKDERRLEREQARQKLGFDPFEATPGISRTIRPEGTPGSKIGTPKGIDAAPVTPRNDQGRQKGKWVKWDAQTPKEQWTPERYPGWVGEDPASPLGR